MREGLDLDEKFSLFIMDLFNTKIEADNYLIWYKLTIDIIWMLD